MTRRPGRQRRSKIPRLNRWLNLVRQFLKIGWLIKSILDLLELLIGDDPSDPHANVRRTLVSVGAR